MSSLFRVLLCLFVIIMSAGSAQANEPVLIGTYGKWQAFKLTENGGQVCYMVAKPTSAKGNYSSRGDVYALITHRPAEGTRNVFSYITGYGYKPTSNATLKIDGSSYLLFTQDDTAWAPDADTDNKLAEAIKKGTRMVVTGTSARGTLTTDTFSLSGSTAAHDAIGKACGL